MLAKLRKRLTFANVVSMIALFVALGGSSYAAIKVTGKNVKDSSLTGKDIKNSSLTTSDVKNRSLLSKDFKSGQLPAGPRGADGRNGTSGFGLLSYAAARSDHIGDGSGPGGGFITCDPGTFPTGGSASAYDTTVDENPVGGVVTGDGIDADATGTPDGWFANWDNKSGQTVFVEIHLVCANADSVLAKSKTSHSTTKRVQLKPNRLR